MPTREDHLNEYTWKSDGLELRDRIFYTLCYGGNKEIEKGVISVTGVHLNATRNSKLLAQLLVREVEAGRLSDDGLDELLLETAL